MANVKEIRDRIKSINDTKKITNAMYLISSNKMRKARKMLEETEPFFFRVQEMMQRVMRHLPPGTKDRFLDLGQMPKMRQRRRTYLVITDDKGLAGAYNHNIMKAAEAEFEKSEIPPRIFAVGEVGRQHFEKSRYELTGQFRYTIQNPTISRARDITSVLVQEYLDGKMDELVAIYTMMKNSTLSEVQVKTLLPLSVPDDILRHIRKSDKGENADALPDNAATQEISDTQGISSREFLMLPDPVTVLDHIIPSSIIGFVYGALVEAFCTVQNDRMMAMDSANKNAADMLRELGMRYNRERQSMITQEITEIVSGARAGRRRGK